MRRLLRQPWPTFRCGPWHLRHPVKAIWMATTGWGLARILDEFEAWRDMGFYGPDVVEFRGVLLPRQHFDLLWQLPLFMQEDLLDDTAWQVSRGPDGLELERQGMRWRCIVRRWCVDFGTEGMHPDWFTAVAGYRNGLVPRDWIQVYDWWHMQQAQFPESYETVPEWLTNKVLQQNQEHYRRMDHARFWRRRVYQTKE